MIEKQSQTVKSKRGQTINLFLLLVLSVVISLLMVFHVDPLPQKLEVGAIASKDIKSDQNYEIVDEKSTAKLREEALKNILPIYDFDPSIEHEAAKRIKEAFESHRDVLQENLNEDPQKGLFSSEIEAEMKKSFGEKMGIDITNEQYDLIRHSQFKSLYEETLIFLVGLIMRNPIIHNKDSLVPLVEKGFAIRKLATAEPFEEKTINDVNEIFDVNEIEKKFMAINLNQITESLLVKESELLTRDDLNVLKDIGKKFIKTNLNYNGIETDARQKKAQNTIKNTIIKIKQGESIIRSGDRFEAWHLTVLEGIRKARLKTNQWLKFLGIFVFVNLVLLIVYVYSSKYIRKFNPSKGDLIFLGLTLVGFLAVLRVGVFLSTSIRDTLPFFVDISNLYYAIPIAGGAMLVRFILNSEIALVFAVILSLFSGIFLENSLEMMVYFLISSVFAAHVIAYVDKRSAVLISGAYTGLINMLTILSLNLISVISISGQLNIYQLALSCLAGFLGGLMTSMLVLVLAPVSEGLFNYTTDIKLLELANLSHPLLKEMIVHAPGTYHHSQIVGILSEAAAQSIGANPLLSRVASYYHDIGKIKTPQYFIENQKGENPHDKLAPSMSALIIETHVKDGMEMASQYKLPQRIAEMIPQHQGTKLISYFYNKAKNLTDPAMGRIDERDYRYPGPRPQTREAGIIMLADTVEAACRSLSEKSPGKIRSTVEKLVNLHFVDEQLDECDLTLRDLHRITEAFIKILIGIYHERIEYPDEAEEENNNKGRMNEQTKDRHASSYQQQTSKSSNIAQLFRKKDSQNH